MTTEQIFKHLQKEGGLTTVPRTRSLQPINFKKGYQVSTMNLSMSFTFVDLSTVVKRVPLWNLDSDSYVGFWVDSATGLLYVEESKHVLELDEAIRLAKQYNQIAVWDWQHMTEIRVQTLEVAV